MQKCKWLEWVSETTATVHGYSHGAWPGRWDWHKTTLHMPIKALLCSAVPPRGTHTDMSPPGNPPHGMQPLIVCGYVLPGCLSAVQEVVYAARTVRKAVGVRKPGVKLLTHERQA